MLPNLVHSRPGLCIHINFNFLTCSLLSVQVQRELVEELWWESWTPAVNSADPTWHVEQQTCLTHSEAGPTQLWTLFTNPTELCVCEAQELFLNCCSLNLIKLLHLHVVLYLYLCVLANIFLSVYVSRVSYLWIKYSLFSYQRDFVLTLYLIAATTKCYIFTSTSSPFSFDVWKSVAQI